jgi:hypothetical protein
MGRNITGRSWLELMDYSPLLWKDLQIKSQIVQEPFHALRTNMHCTVRVHKRCSHIKSSNLKAVHTLGSYLITSGSEHWPKGCPNGYSQHSKNRNSSHWSFWKPRIIWLIWVWDTLWIICACTDIRFLFGEYLPILSTGFWIFRPVRRFLQL